MSIAQAQPSPLMADTEADGWRAALRLAWSIYWPLRLLTLGIGILVGLANVRGQSPGLGEWINQVLFAPWDQQDVTWYLKIATGGYGIPDGRAAYHPLLPMLMGGLGRVLGGQYVLAGFIVNDLACLGALAAFYKLVRMDYDPQVARHSLDWLMYCPIGFVLLIPYTESLTLGWIFLAFWFARHDRWFAAGLAGALATLTKHSAIVLALGLLVEYLSTRRRPLLSWRSAQVFASLSLVPLGYLAFSVYRLWITPLVNPTPGELASALVVSPQLNQLWGNRFGTPIEWLVKILQFAFSPDTYGWFWINVGLTITGLIVVWVSLRRSRRSVAIYSAVTAFLIMTIILPGDPLMSSPRRFLLIFAVFIQIGLWSSQSERLYRWRFISLAIQILLVLGFVTDKYVP
jgi:hypothetical protein